MLIIFANLFWTIEGLAKDAVSVSVVNIGELKSPSSLLSSPSWMMLINLGLCRTFGLLGESFGAEETWTT